MITPQPLSSRVGQGGLELEVAYCVGGVISPVLANIYLHELDRTWVERGYERPGGLDAKLIRYADDILIVSSKPVTERLRARLAEHLGELGLTVSPEKTRVTTAAEGFDFLAATRGRMVRAGSLNGGSSVMTA